MKRTKLILFVLLRLILNSSAQTWDSLGTDFKYGVGAFSEADGKLFVLGGDSINGMSLHALGAWDGSNWDTIPTRVWGGVNTVTRFNNDLYIGGSFFDIGYIIGTPFIKALTKYDGSQFYDLGFSTTNSVVSTIIYNNELYCGGEFQSINGQPFYNIAKYDGTNWSCVGGGVTGTFGQVYAMTIFNGDLIVAGEFDLAGTTQVSNIARWDGTTWHPLGDGINYIVFRLCVDSINNILYASGNFSGSGSTPLNYIGQWDGNSWQPLGNGIHSTVLGLAMYKGNLYAGTDATFIPGTMYKWDGSNWTQIIPEPDSLIINCMYSYKGDLYVGGTFKSVGGVPYSGLAKYTDTTITALPVINSEGAISIYPNPATNEIVITLSEAFDNPIFITIKDLLGKQVLQQKLDSHEKKLRIKLPDTMVLGVYNVTVEDRSHLFTKKIVVSSSKK